MTTATHSLPAQPDDIVVSGEGGGKDFAPHPTGPHSAVCCDIVDLGVWQDSYPGQAPRNVRKIRLLFQTDEKREDGKRFTVGRMFTASLGEKANLRKFIESWRGVSFTPDELRGFSLSKLIGAPALIQVKHRPKGEKVYADIDSVMRLPRGMEKLSVLDYVRVKDREQAKPANPAHQDYEDFPAPLVEEEDDLPF